LLRPSSARLIAPLFPNLNWIKIPSAPERRLIICVSVCRGRVAGWRRENRVEQLGRLAAPLRRLQRLGRPPPAGALDGFRAGGGSRLRRPLSFLQDGPLPHGQYLLIICILYSVLFFNVYIFVWTKSKGASKTELVF